MSPCRYGGQQLCDEIAGLSNECARTCNRSRSLLDPEQRTRLDALTAELGALFVDPLDLDPEAKAGSIGVEEPSAECWGQLQVLQCVLLLYPTCTSQLPLRGVPAPGGEGLHRGGVSISHYQPSFHPASTMSYVSLLHVPQARYAPVAYLLSDCLAGAAVVSGGDAAVSEHQVGGRGLHPSSSEVIRAQRQTAAAAAERAGEDGEGRQGGSVEDDEGEESGGGEGKGDVAAAAALRRLSARSSKRLAELVTAQVKGGGSGGAAPDAVAHGNGFEARVLLSTRDFHEQ